MAALDFEIKDVPSSSKEIVGTDEMLQNILKRLKSLSQRPESENLTSALPSTEEVLYTFESNLGESVGHQSLGETENLLKSCGKGETEVLNDRKSLETVQTLRALRYASNLHQEMEKTGLLTVQQVCDIHHVLLGRLHPESGQIRSSEVFTNTDRGRHFYPTHTVVESLFYSVLDRHNEHMERMKDKFGEKLTYDKLVYIFKCAAWLMFHFVAVHPFPDGNGRTCRLLANYILGLFNPFPITVCHSEHCNRAEYIDIIIRCREHPHIGLGELTALLVKATWCGWHKSPIQDVTPRPYPPAC